MTSLTRVETSEPAAPPRPGPRHLAPPPDPADPLPTPAAPAAPATPAAPAAPAASGRTALRAAEDADAIADAERAVAALPPIHLGELVAEAGLLTRVDRKYVVPLTWLGDLVRGMEPGARVLEIDGLRGFGYRSVYFDTVEYTSYLGAALRRRRRFKVRTRSYLDADTCYLEVKTRGARGATVKHRLRYYGEYERSVAPGRWFVDRVLDGAGILRSEHLVLDVVLASHYRRTTFLLPASGSRVTVDTRLHWVDGAGRRLRMPGFAIVETKTGSTPSSIDRLLWRHGHRPTRISKYATALAALNPQLPSTPWRRTIGRCFSPEVG